MFVHLQESLHLFTDGLLYVLGHFLALKIFQELLNKLLLFVRLFVKVGLERIIYFLILLLRLLLIVLELVLFLELGPYSQLAHEIGE